tara:strand:- start:7200 stop:7505 length:306 start_codon:yes stop_codon:yes gene_type:complete
MTILNKILIFNKSRDEKKLCFECNGSKKCIHCDDNGITKYQEKISVGTGVFSIFVGLTTIISFLQIFEGDKWMIPAIIIFLISGILSILVMKEYKEQRNKK